MAARSSPLGAISDAIATLSTTQAELNCVLSNKVEVRLPLLLAPFLKVGDEITFPAQPSSAEGTELLACRRSVSGGERCLYAATTRYVSSPKPDRHNRHFVCAEVLSSYFGIGVIHLPCEVLREYFYDIPSVSERKGNRSLYELLRVESTVTQAEIRVAFKLRALELQTANASTHDRLALERAFNILAEPELRACYDALLADPDAPAALPYAAVGLLVVTGERSRDGQTFWARRILAFSPERKRRRFELLLRQCDFYEGKARYRDVRRGIELWLDPAVLYTNWDPTWNQWKHLLRTKIQVEGTVVRGSVYKERRGGYELVAREAVLPSKLEVTVPKDFQAQVKAAQDAYQRFGRFSAALAQVRRRLELCAIEKTELERICSKLGIPTDFDIAQISWRPDYDELFYRQLSQRARRLYLFRDEYIFDVEKAVVVETPQLGHATYVFSKPRILESFLRLYTRTSKDDIRRNRDNVAGQLGFLKRVIHGTSSRAWLKELSPHLGENADFASALSE
jgi:hypothetical protein